MSAPIHFIIVAAAIALLPSTGHPQAPAPATRASTSASNDPRLAAALVQLDRFLRTLPARPDPTVARVVAAKVGYSESPMTAFVHWYPETSARKPYVLQRDSALRTPMADVGDTLFVYDKEMKLAGIARVVARRAFRFVPFTSDCHGGPQSNGWAYSVTGLVSSNEESDSRTGVVLSRRLRTEALQTVQGSARAPLRSGLKVILDSIHASRVRENPERARTERSTLREEVYGPADAPVLESLEAYQLRGPGGQRWFVVPLSLPDYAYVRDGTSILLIFDATGKVVARREGSYWVRAIGDLNSDGVQEIIFGDGIAVWNGTRWLVPTIEPSAPMC